MALNFSEASDTEMIYSKFKGTKGYTLREYKTMNIPFQFNQMSDPRITKAKPSSATPTTSDGTIGRMYDKTIIRNAPVFIIRPGRPTFLSNGAIFGGGDADEKRKSMILEALKRSDGAGDGNFVGNWADSEKDESSLSDALTDKENNGYNPLRYYDFESAFEKYCTYVSRIVRTFAFAMSGFDEKDTSQKKKIANFKSFNASLNWGSDLPLMKKDTAGKDMYNSRFLSFYLDSSSSYSDSFSNSTSESSLAGKIKGASKMVKEGQFLFGSQWNANTKGTQGQESIAESFKNNVGQGGIGGLMNNSLLANAFNTTLSGGNMLFPEVWDDSQYSKDYSVSIKLFSPYGDPYSIFTNIYIPMAYLMALVLPIQSSPQGYEGPFIVKSYVRGMFSCDLGMFNSLSISRGDNSLMTIDGLPTEIEVTLGLKDLYSTMMMSITNSNLSILFGNNTGLVEYIYALSGVELFSSKPFLKKLAQALKNITNLPADLTAALISTGKGVISQAWENGKLVINV